VGGAVPLAKGNIPFVVAIIGRWKYGIGGGAGSGPRPSIFQNTQEKIEKMQIKVFTTGGSLDKGYSTRDSDFIVQGPQIGNILEEANQELEAPSLLPSEGGLRVFARGSDEFGFLSLLL